MKMIAAHVIIQGMVQGVGFRVTSQQKAVQLGLNGWVKNLSNGGVELLAEGPEEQVDQFLEFIKEGPSRFANVENMKVDKSKNVEGYQKFEITG